MSVFGLPSNQRLELADISPMKELRRQLAAAATSDPAPLKGTVSRDFLLTTFSLKLIWLTWNLDPNKVKLILILNSSIHANDRLEILKPEGDNTTSSDLPVKCQTYSARGKSCEIALLSW